MSAPRPLYVISLDVPGNRVVVGYEERTINTVVRADQINWVSVESLDGPVHASAKIRSTGTPVSCNVRIDEVGRLCATFDVPVKAATPGQSLVVYDNDRVLCGGIIESVD